MPAASPPDLVTPALDHVVVNTRDRLDDAAACYRGLGFGLTPLGRHTLGSINRLAVFGADYLELVGIDPAATAQRRELLEFPAGLNGLVFATADAAALHRALAAKAAPVAAPAEFSRPVTIAGKSETARFRVVRIMAAAAPYGRVYFCEHLTPHLVWRDEWRHHANAAVGVARVVIAASDPAATGTLYRQLFGADCLRPVPGGLSLAMGAARLDILTLEAVAASFGAAAPAAAGRPAHLAALGIRVGDLGRTRTALAGRAGVEGGRILVASADAFGLALEFVG
ncbi:MAG TPA: VOC family protein [Stellaceae bacterium]|nr:VOC family protein [Stellaceae bacterium]